MNPDEDEQRPPFTPRRIIAVALMGFAAGLTTALTVFETGLG